MRIDFQASRFVVARAQRLTQIGTHITAQNWIDDVEDFTRPVAHARYYLPTLTAQVLQWRGRKAYTRLRQFISVRFPRTTAVQFQQRDVSRVRS